MGEWSDFFEDFPEENPANDVDGRFDPRRAERRRAAGNKGSAEQARLDAEIASIIRKHGKQKEAG